MHLIRRLIRVMLRRQKKTDRKQCVTGLTLDIDCERAYADPVYALFAELVRFATELVAQVC